MSVNIFENGKLKKIAGNVRDDDTADSTVTFESGDNLNPVAPTDVPLITSGETHKSLFHKLSTMAKNVRYLLKLLGTTDISIIADGTVTGAIAKINSDTQSVQGKIGDFSGSIYIMGGLAVNAGEVVMNTRKTLGNSTIIFFSGKYIFGCNMTFKDNNIITSDITSGYTITATRIDSDHVKVSVAGPLNSYSNQIVLFSN